MPVATRLARRARSSRILGSKIEACLPMPRARRSSTPRPRSTGQSGPLAPASTSKRSSSNPAVPRAVSVAITRKAPAGTTSRLSLGRVHHRCCMTSRTSGPRSLVSRSGSWVSSLNGSKAIVRTGRPEGCWTRMTPTGGTSSRWTTSRQGSRPVTVQSQSLRHAKEMLVSAELMVQVPVGGGYDRRPPTPAALARLGACARRSVIPCSASVWLSLACWSFMFLFASSDPSLCDLCRNSDSLSFR
jgi:hypothetical protein